MKARSNRKFRQHLSTATDARAVRTREALRTALLSLLQHKTMDEIGIREIAAEAGIGHATFYRHHPTKEALLHDLAADEVQRMLGYTLPLMDAKGSQAACAALLRYADERRALWLTFLTGGAASDVREELLQLALGVAAERMPEQARLIGELCVRLLVGGTLEVLTWWLKHPSPPAIQDAARILSQGVVMPVIGKVAALADVPATDSRVRSTRKAR